MNQKARKAKQDELKSRIEKLALKIEDTSWDVKRFGKALYRRGLTTWYKKRDGMIRHWEKMARISLRATRKKLYRLQNEFKAL